MRQAERTAASGRTSRRTTSALGKGFGPGPARAVEPVIGPASESLRRMNARESAERLAVTGAALLIAPVADIANALRGKQVRGVRRCLEIGTGPANGAHPGGLSTASIEQPYRMTPKTGELYSLGVNAY